MALVEQLAEIELFSELSKKELKRVASYMTPITVKAGRDLTVQGQPGREFMIIAEGEATVRRNGRVIARFGPGDFFGELAVIAGVPPHRNRHRRHRHGGRGAQPTRVHLDARRVVEDREEGSRRGGQAAPRTGRGSRQIGETPPPEIAVVGSANLDLVVDVERVPQVGETVLGGDLRRIPGGKGANQAVAAARLGRRVAMIGRVGDDDAGEMLRAAIGSDGVDTAGLRTTPDTPSGTALIAVAADGDNAIVVSPGANGRLSPRDLEQSVAVLSGATLTLLQLEVPVDTVRAAVSLAAGTVVLNPAPASAADLPSGLLAGIDVLVPNQTELATLAGHRGEVDAEVATETGPAPERTDRRRHLGRGRCPRGGGGHRHPRGGAGGGPRGHHGGGRCVLCRARRRPRGRRRPGGSGAMGGAGRCRHDASRRCTALAPHPHRSRRPAGLIRRIPTSRLPSKGVSSGCDAHRLRPRRRRCHRAVDRCFAGQRGRDHHRQRQRRYRTHDPQRARRGGGDRTRRPRPPRRRGAARGPGDGRSSRARTHRSRRGRRPHDLARHRVRRRGGSSSSTQRGASPISTSSRSVRSPTSRSRSSATTPSPTGWAA